MPPSVSLMSMISHPPFFIGKRLLRFISTKKIPPPPIHPLFQIPSCLRFPYDCTPTIIIRILQFDLKQKIPPSMHPLFQILSCLRFPYNFTPIIMIRILQIDFNQKNTPFYAPPFPNTQLPQISLQFHTHHNDKNT